MYDFLIHLFGNLDAKQKSYKIESSLSEANILDVLNTQLEYQKHNFTIDNRVSCIKCNKGFFDPGIVFIYPRTYYHPECYNTILFDIGK
jgi:hypothetical protein